MKDMQLPGMRGKTHEIHFNVEEENRRWLMSDVASLYDIYYVHLYETHTHHTILTIEVMRHDIMSCSMTLYHIS